MADAGPSREKGNLRERVPRIDQERWRAIRPLCGLERSVLRRVHLAGDCRMRLILRSIWSNRPPGPNDYTDCAETRLLFPVALRLALVVTTFDGDSRASDRPGRCHHRPASSAVPVRRRRK